MSFSRGTVCRGVAQSILLAAFLCPVGNGSLAQPLDLPDKGTPPRLEWPAAPMTPRIRFVQGISSARDLKLKGSSFFRRALKAFLGLDNAHPGLIFPYGVTTDSQHRLIVLDSKARLIHVFDRAERKYFVIRPPKGEAFISLVGVAIDSEDNLYVSDSYTGKILVFEKSGRFKKRLGPAEGMFKRPTGLAIDRERGRLYVVETVRDEVHVLDLDGKPLFKFGRRGDGDGEFNFPTQICVRDDRVYVTDTLNARLQVFDRDGHFLSSLGRLGDASGDFNKPKGVSLDSEGHIYVVEGLRDVVEIFDAEGRFLLEFGGSGSREGELFLPTAIHIDRDDTVYISDSSNGRVQVFQYLKESASSAR